MHHGERLAKKSMAAQKMQFMENLGDQLIRPPTPSRNYLAVPERTLSKKMDVLKTLQWQNFSLCPQQLAASLN